VFPRTYFPVHGPFGHAGRGGRFESDDHSTTTNGEAEGGSATRGRGHVGGAQDFAQQAPARGCVE
jgi:hypothetical protein